MAAPGPITMPDQNKVSDLSILQPSIKAPRGTIQGDQAERTRMLNTGAGVDQIYGKIANSDFGQHHQILGKILGGLAQGVGKLGDIGLSAVAPALAINLPGTEYHHMAQLHGLNKQIGAEEGEQEKEAQTANQQSEMGARPSEVALRGAQSREAEARANALENPQPKEKEEHWSITPEYTGPNGEPVEMEQNSGQIRIAGQGGPAFKRVEKEAAQKGLEHVSIVGPNGKPMEANFHPDTGKYTDSSGKEIVNPQPYEKPNQAGTITLIAPDPNNPGGGIVQRVGAGAHVAPGSQTAAGFNAMNTPTTTQRTAAGRAQTVVEMAPEVMSRIDSVANQLGPIEGRWNEFMQGKVGMDNPQFAALRSDLLMLSSAVALAHAQGRLPENLREEFDRAINAPRQTPANLKATIQTMIPWLQQVQNQGQRQGGQSQGTAANPVATHRFNTETGEIEEIKK